MLVRAMTGDFQLLLGQWQSLVFVSDVLGAFLAGLQGHCLRDEAAEVDGVRSCFVTVGINKDVLVELIVVVVVELHCTTLERLYHLA